MMPISAVTFTANTQTNDSKRREKEVVTDGAAIAAGTKATRASVKTYTSGNFRKGMHTVTQATSGATKITKQSTSLWGRVCQNAKSARESILQWGAQFKNFKYVRPFVENKAFRALAGGFGYAFGAIALLSGLADIYDSFFIFKEKLEK